MHAENARGLVKMLASQVTGSYNYGPVLRPRGPDETNGDAPRRILFMGAGAEKTKHELSM
jgi:hypothetical protein